MATLEWEGITKEDTKTHGISPVAYRGKVFGGWLVRLTGDELDTTMTFVPDAKHEWK